MEHTPDYMYKYLEEAIDTAIVRARPLSDCPIKTELIKTLEKSLSLAIYLREENRMIGGKK